MQMPWVYLWWVFKCNYAKTRVEFKLRIVYKAIVLVHNMVGIAQLVEHWIVIPSVAGSNPVTHLLNPSF